MVFVYWLYIQNLLNSLISYNHLSLFSFGFSKYVSCYLQIKIALFFPFQSSFLSFIYFSCLTALPRTSWMELVINHPCLTLFLDLLGGYTVAHFASSPYFIHFPIYISQFKRLKKEKESCRSKQGKAWQSSPLWKGVLVAYCCCNKLPQM